MTSALVAERSLTLAFAEDKRLCATSLGREGPGFLENARCFSRPFAGV